MIYCDTAVIPPNLKLTYPCVSKGDAMERQIKQHPYATGFVILLVLVLILFIFLAYRLIWDWTGFSSGTNRITITSTSTGNYTATLSQPPKSLWDWLQLLGVLAIPAVVALGAAWYTAQQGKASERENTDNQRETALQTYIDNMSELLLHEKLRDSAEEDEVRKIARVRTLTILARLDANRKRSVLQFLYESGLLFKDNRIIDLRSVGLRVADEQFRKLGEWDLRGAGLYAADLSEASVGAANLREVILSGVYLPSIDLSGSDLRGADLRRADLNEADLGGAMLSGADLHGADLSGGADFSGADLSNANLKAATGITTEELEKQAKSLKGAIMPDGSKHP
jgi:uncharacterized protein YjbI with pentapeptide repeats